MLRQLVTLFKVLSTIAVDYFREDAEGASLSDQENRVAVQKLIYLAQVYGIPMGYSYSWDTFGPYSRALSDDLEDMRRNLTEVRKLAPQLDFKDEVLTRLLELKVALEVPAELPSETAWLEILSSLHMLARHMFPLEQVEQLRRP